MDLIKEEVLIIGTAIFSISLISTVSLIPLINKIGLKFNLVDKPNKRKIHKTNIVRIGGLGVIIGFLIGSICLIFLNTYLGTTNINYQNFLLIILGSFCFFLIGFLDDIYDYSPFIRLIIEVLITSILFSNGLKINSIDLSWININLEHLILNNFFSYLFVVFWLVGITNAINWLDGLDALAGGISTIIILNLCMIFISNQDWIILFLALGLCGSLIGFLRYNIFPAKILMGDGGSYLLGSGIGILSILGLNNNSINYQNFLNNTPENSIYFFPINIALIILFIPIADMTFVILNRIRNNKSPFHPDKSHFHHKLLELGLSPRRSVIILYSLQITFSCISIIVLGLKSKIFYICITFILLLLSFLYLLNMKQYLDPNYKKR